MIDWSLIVGFQWDQGNARKSVEKHAVSKFEAEQVFFNQPLLVLQDRKHSHNELRLHALGKTDHDRLLHISFTLRSANSLIRVISARDMHRKERMIYEQQKEST
ncbi:MAG: BrnT family toxin [Pseudomonadales bacterium]|nr:BrnT family toxin [Pseudomonadales bacterium]